MVHKIIKIKQTSGTHIKPKIKTALLARLVRRFGIDNRGLMEVSTQPFATVSV